MAARIRNVADWLNENADQIPAGCPTLCSSLVISFEVMMNDMNEIDTIPTIKMQGEFIDQKSNEATKRRRKKLPPRI